MNSSIKDVCFGGRKPQSAGRIHIFSVVQLTFGIMFTILLVRKPFTVSVIPESWLVIPVYDLQRFPLALSYACILHPEVGYIFRLPYTCLSLFYGQDVPSLGFLRVSKPSCHRYRIIPYCDRTFLLDMWAKINLADSSENSGQ